MATHARQQYFADESSLSKEKREFSIAEEVQQKIDSIEEGAQVNTIETIKVNGSEVQPDENKAVDLTIPGVVDSLDSTSSTDALSARQGKVLYDYIQDVSHIGHFLALWDASTGLPVTDPETSPYIYNTGDFYTVSVVASQGGTNYKPDGTQYVIGQASTAVETDDIAVNDFYFYDGTTWRHMKNSGAGSIAIDGSLSTSSTNPVENRVITNALNGKQDTLIAGTNIQIAADGKTISATDTTYTAGNGINISNDVIDADTSVLATKTELNTKQDKLIPGSNIQIASDGKTISATDTTYTAGTGISIDANNVISNTQTSAEWGNITGTLSDQTDLQDALDEKQDKLTAGDNITIENVCGYNSQGPMPDGFHIPTSAEWTSVKSVWTTLGGSGTDGVSFGDILKLPRAGEWQGGNGTIYGRGTEGLYWSCSTISGSYYTQMLSFTSNRISSATATSAAHATPLRPFKNIPVSPDSSWVELYPGIGIGIGIYRSAALGLISLSSDGQTRITMSDKNLGATEVWNSGDTLTAANCGNYYQWGNNYGFPFTGPTTTSSTQVDASSYGPGNYYSSSTFITTGGLTETWDSSRNTNLWGGDNPTGTQCNLTISAQVPEIEVDDEISSISENPVQNKVIKAALDGKVNLGENKVFDSTVVEIGKWEDEGGVQSSGHNVTIDPSGEVSTYNITTGGHNEATLGSANLTLLENSVLGGDETTVISQDGITITEGQTTQTYNFLGNDRIAKLSDISGLSDLNTKTFQGYRGVGYLANAQAVYDRISTGKYAIVEVKNGDGDWKGNVIFGPTNVTTGTINSWEYSHTHQSSFGSYYEGYNSLVMEVTDGVVTQAYGSGTALNINGHLVIKSDTAPSSPVQGSMWYDTTNDQLKAYDGTNWNEVGSDAADINTKTFYLSGTSDLTNAQAAVDWYLEDKNPIIIYSTKAYTLRGISSSSLIFAAPSQRSSGGDCTILTTPQITFNISNNAVTSIDTTGEELGRYLATNIGYPTVYTPVHNSSPATKKYVDDAIAGVGGGIEVDENSPIQLTKIRAGTQAQYDALASYDATTVYLTI